MAAGRNQRACLATVRSAGLACAPWLRGCPLDHEGPAPGRVARAAARYTIDGLSHGLCQGTRRAQRTTDAKRFHPDLTVGFFHRTAATAESPRHSHLGQLDKHLRSLGRVRHRPSGRSLSMAPAASAVQAAICVRKHTIRVSKLGALSTNFTARGGLRTVMEL